MFEFYCNLELQLRIQILFLEFRFAVIILCPKNKEVYIFCVAKIVIPTKWIQVCLFFLSRSCIFKKKSKKNLVSCDRCFIAESRPLIGPGGTPFMFK
jgi:hypothetical protein